jgi:hypothetical protein
MSISIRKSRGLARYVRVKPLLKVEGRAKWRQIYMILNLFNYADKSKPNTSEETKEKRRRIAERNKEKKRLHRQKIMANRKKKRLARKLAQSNN